MRKFIIKCGVFIITLLAFIMFGCFILDRKGYSDSAYKRFTSSESTSLIVGSSRAAQGIVPEYINESFDGTQYSLPIYNFSFNVFGTPFGEYYLSQIQGRIKNGVFNNKGLFIVSVDPFVLAEDEIWDAGKMREKKSDLTDFRPFYKPNFRYMLKKCRPSEWVGKRIDNLQDDGWLKVEFQYIDDTLIVRNNIDLKIKDYRERKLKKSEYRKYWLYQTIELFKSHGEVYLCRIPVSKEMKAIEDALWADFDKDMRTTSQELSVPYFSFIDDCGMYRTTDGNHLYYEDGIKFTKALVDSIKYCKQLPEE